MVIINFVYLVLTLYFAIGVGKYSDTESRGKKTVMTIAFKPSSMMHYFYSCHRKHC